MTPWDGPAAVVFTDGTTIGAHLDRNGLRPLRYVITADGIMVAGSEVGMIDLGDRSIIKQGRLGPGDILSIDLNTGSIRETGEILDSLAARLPYGQWLHRFLVTHRLQPISTPPSNSTMLEQQVAFGYTTEEVDTMLATMARTAGELTFSMGDDTPLPPLAEKPPLLFRYFKQRFSQITNPSIDPIREKMGMSLAMHLGPRRSFLSETADHARRYCIPSPLVFEEDICEIETRSGFRTVRIMITYSHDSENLAAAVTMLRRTALEVVGKGAEIIILTDRTVSKKLVAIPSLLAVSAVSQELIRKECGHCVSIIVETGEARDVHHIACLMGFGAAAVHPWLITPTIAELCSRGVVEHQFDVAMDNYRKAVEDGLLKVLGRLGISTLDSYYGAQLFDIICINHEVVNEYFGHVACNYGSGRAARNRGFCRSPPSCGILSTRP